MITRPKDFLVVTALAGVVNAGCICGPGWCLSCANVWTDSVTDRIVLDGTQITAMDVVTSNGSIEFTGDSAASDAPVIEFTKKAGARTIAGAKEALAAIDVYVEPDEDGARRIGWKWKQPKRSSWSAQVNFKIRAAPEISFDATSHNGAIDAAQAAGDLKLVTHNGRIHADSKGERLAATSHNGRISVSFSGKHVSLMTHNGALTADLARCEAVEGSIQTANGAIQVAVGPDTSANLSCRTDNGSIASSATLNGVTRYSNNSLKGTLGQGGGMLAVSTNNGSIKIKQGAG